MAMNEVFAFKTSDGELFESKSEACKHEDELQRTNTIREWVGRHCYSQMHTGDIEDALVEFGDELGI